MLSYEDIVEAPLGKLKAAADDWSEMAAKLEQLADQATDGLKAKADKANWEGLNAGVTKAFVGKTAKEFADAASEAKGVKALLEEGYAAFKKAKDDLIDIRENEGLAAGIRVDGRGRVTARSPLSENDAARHDPDFSKYLQHLGLNLATASHDKAFSAEWGPELRKMGTERIPLAKHDNSGPYGYQLLGGIMRYGNYDPKFLNPMAEHVVQLRQKDHDFFYGSKGLPGGPENPLNPSGVNGSGYDPVNSMLEALGHSPEAAKQFFSAEPTVYNEDGTPKKDDADPGKNKDGQEITSYLDFFQNENYDPFYDITGHDRDDMKKSIEYMPDALGKALEAATTGHAWDDPSPTLKRDDVTAGIMKNVIDSYGVDSGLRDRHEPMKDSLARMGAAYIDDLNYSTYNFGGHGDEAGREELFMKSSDESKRTDFGYDSAHRFMVAVATDDEGYRMLSGAQQVYEASGLRSFGDSKDDAQAFGGNATKVHGILDESRSFGISVEFKDDEDAKNLAMEKSAEWRKAGVSGAVTAVVGVGSAVVLGPAAGVVAAVAVPLVMESAGNAVSAQYGTDTLQYLKDAEFSNDDQALTSIDRNASQGKVSAAAVMFHYADSVGMTEQEKRALFAEIETQYNNGATAVRHHGKVD